MSDKPDPGQQFAAAFVGVAARRLVHHPRRQCHVGQCGHVGEQIERLEHHAHRLTGLVAVDAGVADVAAVEQDLAVVDFLEQVDAPQQRGFPRSGGSDQHHDVVFFDVEVDPVQYWPVAVGLHESAHRQNGGAGHSAPCLIAERRAAQSASRADGTASATNNSPATT